MIKLKHLEFALYFIVWFSFIAILVKCSDDTINKGGCTYHRVVDPSGKETLKHSDTCSCTTTFSNEVQFEFQVWE